MMNATSARFLSLYRSLIIVLMLGCATTAQAFDNDREQIAKQIKHHEKAVEKCLVGFRIGDESVQQSEQANIAASEAYLSVLNFPANDPRLAGHLYDEQLAASPANVAGFSSRLFHHRLKQRTGFVIDLNAALVDSEHSDAKAK